MEQNRKKWIKKIANIGYAVTQWNEDVLRAIFEEIDENQNYVTVSLLPELIYRIFKEYNKMENAQIDAFESISKLLESISNEAIMILNQTQYTFGSQIIYKNAFITNIAYCLIQIGNQPKYKKS